MKLLSGILLLILSVMMLSACGGTPTFPAPQLKQILADGAVLVDVRTQSEVESGSLAGAIHLPHGQILELPEKAAVNKDTPIVLYCRSGHRSGLATKALNDAGYTNVHNGGGYQELKKTLEESESKP